MDVLMSLEQVALYRSLLEKVPDGSMTLELGVFQGGSLSYMADIIRRKKLRVWAVDLFDTVDYEEPNSIVMSSKNGMLATYWKRMSDSAIRPFTVVGTCEDVAVWLRHLAVKPHFIFIDADHSYEWCKRDIETLWPFLAEGGTMAGHDFDDRHPGVLQAVCEKFPQFNPKSFPLDIWHVVKG